MPIWRSLGDAKRTASALNNIAVCLNTLGDPARALEYYTEALPLLRTVGDRVDEGNLLNNIGRAYSALGNHQRAMEHLGGRSADSGRDWRSWGAGDHDE